jgi:hypothetical protein
VTNHDPRALLSMLLLFGLISAGFAQIDPEKRRLIQLGYNQPIEGRGPIAGYGFFYYNQPNFLQTNLTLRAAVAPIYLDAELGFTSLLGPHTDLGLGLAGGGFADSYAEIHEGDYRREESFIGHSAEISMGVYHRFNPDQELPLSGIVRLATHRAFYEADSKTAHDFKVPDDHTTLLLRSGLRLGGREPTMTAPLALEVSVWHEARFRTDSDRYGYDGDRRVEANSHLFWTRALGRYTFDESKQLVELGVTAGTTLNADRFSAYRLGGVLPFVSEFPLNIPGYYFQELSARQFALLNGQYTFPVEPRKQWYGTLFAATGFVDYLAGSEQPGNWHSGVGGGVTYRSPAGSWFVTLTYAYGVDAIRDHDRGANQIGILFQYDFEAKAKWFSPGVSPYRSRGAERLFRE